MWEVLLLSPPTFPDGKTEAQGGYKSCPKTPVYKQLSSSAFVCSVVCISRAGFEPGFLCRATAGWRGGVCWVRCEPLGHVGSSRGLARTDQALSESVPVVPARPILVCRY